MSGINYRFFNPKFEDRNRKQLLSSDFGLTAFKIAINYTACLEVFGTMKLLYSNILFAIIFTFPVFGQAYKLYPTNELYRDSALTHFVCKLQYAVFKKDKNYLLSVVDPKIKNNFGGDSRMCVVDELILEPTRKTMGAVPYCGVHAYCAVLVGSLKQ